MSDDIVARLREHADQVAGGGPSDDNYDPETLDVEHEAADEIERLRALLVRWRYCFAHLRPLNDSTLERDTIAALRKGQK